MRAAPMNPAADLDHLLRRLEPATPDNRAWRLRFGLACAERVAHLLEAPEVLDGLARFRAALERGSDDPELDRLAETLPVLAQRHPGSRLLDGVGHAAVSASYTCAMAVRGQARQAAEYAAYAMVYGQGGYGATSDVASFAPEHAWQLARLRELLAPS